MSEMRRPYQFRLWPHPEVLKAALILAEILRAHREKKAGEMDCSKRWDAEPRGAKRLGDSCPSEQDDLSTPSSTEMV